MTNTTKTKERAEVRRRLEAIAQHVYGCTPRQGADPAAIASRGSTLWSRFWHGRLFSGDQPHDARSPPPPPARSPNESWLLCIAMALCFAVCGALAALYDVSRCARLFELVRAADVAVAPFGGTVAVLFEQWKHGELVYWRVYTMAMCALVPTTAHVFLSALLYGTASFYLLVLVLFTLAVCQTLYHVLGRRSGNRAMLLALVDDLTDPDEPYEPADRNLKQD